MTGPNALGPLWKAGIGGATAPPQLRCRGGAVSKRLKGCLRCNQNKAAPFLEYDVGGSRQQVAGDAVGDSAETAHRAGGHNHYDWTERPTRNRSGEVANWICHIREPPHVSHLHARLMCRCDFYPSAVSQGGFPQATLPRSSDRMAAKGHSFWPSWSTYAQAGEASDST
jgi:hypothetical protein